MLAFSLAGRAHAQTPGTPDPEFNPATVAATVYALLFVQGTDGSKTIYVGGDTAYDENLQPNGVIKGNFVAPTFGTEGRIIFTEQHVRCLPENPARRVVWRVGVPDL